MKIKRADWVECKSTPAGPLGIVKRVARDGSWADVKWCLPGGRPYVKRMHSSALVVLDTIPLPGGVTVTDMTREREFQEAL